MAKAIEVMREKYEVVAAMFHGFDFRSGISGSAKERLATLAGALNWILEMQQRDADREATNKGKIRTRRRFSDTVLTLVKAFSLAAASDEALRIRDDVAFFTAVLTALEKMLQGATSPEKRMNWQFSRSSTAQSSRRKSLIYSLPPD